MIAVLCAMKSELNEVVARMDSMHAVEEDGMTYYCGLIADRETVASECGVGKVASAVVCSMMISRFHPELLINVGVAGGCRDFENTLDIIVGERLTYHDWNNLVINNQPNGFDTNQYVFHGDPQLNQLAVSAFRGNCRTHIYRGDIVSGDTFVTLKEDVERIIRDYPEAYCCDMESASIAHCCSMQKTPFLILRSLSDIVTRENNDLDFEQFCIAAASQAADLLVSFLKIYSER